MVYGALLMGVLVGLPPYPLPRRGVDVDEEVIQLAIQVREGRTADRIHAIQALGDLRERARAALGTLCEYLYEPALQVAAADAVRRIAPDLYPSIDTMLFSADLNGQIAASARLGRLGEKALNIAPFLREHAMRVMKPAGAGDVDLRASCAARDAATLAQVAPEHPATPALVKYLLGRAEEAARPRFSQVDLLGLVNAAITLYNRKSEEHRDLVPFLIAALDGPSRLEVVQLIGRNPCGPAEVVRRLRGLAASGNSQVRDASTITLKKIQEYLDKLGKPMPG